MNVDIMQMNPNIAAVHYKEYRKRVRLNRELRLAEAQKKVAEGGKIFRAGRIEKSQVEKEDEQLMQAYREMAKGQRIINAASVIREAKLNKQQLPNLAIGRADWTECFLLWKSYGNGHFQFSKDRWGESLYGNRKSYKHGSVDFPLHTLTANVQNQEWRKSHDHPTLPVQALVPSIPPALRPAGDLADYYILWEAVWEKKAPVDPLLLKHISGHLYTVVAQWDLSPIERSVLEGRIT